MDNYKCKKNQETECLGPHMARGMCRRHYKRRYRKRNLKKVQTQQLKAYHANRDKKLATMRKHKYSPKGRLSALIYNCKLISRECSLTLQEYSDLLAKSCYYCEEPLPPSRCTGLDRIDNSKGYSIDNVLPCCGDCNILRMHKLTVDEAKLLSMTLKSYRKSKNEAA